MITIIDIDKKEMLGLSTDTKPNNVPVNSFFLELDTTDLYYCAKGGSQSKEVVYEGEVSDGGELQLVLDGTITVVYGGTTYVCEPKTAEEDGETWTYYGATITIAEGEYVHDWAEYPFVIAVYEDNVTVSFEDEGTHSLSITSLVTTEAEWVKYGEAPSGGDMINVYFMDVDGNEISAFTSQIAKGESVTIPQYDGASMSVKAYLTTMEPSSQTYRSGDTFTPTDEYIFTEVPSNFPFEFEATTPFVMFGLIDA